jgi:TPP-dependent indolepyruvate ferredoxin oxidoreductase alpha subunit
MDPSRTIDACLCYGVSVGVATGAALAASNSRVFCITGDGAYLHSGRSALDEAVARGVTLTVILFDNGGCLGTGGQRIPGSLQVPDAGVLAIDVTFPEAEAEKLAAALDRCLAWQGVSVLRVKTPL